MTTARTYRGKFVKAKEKLRRDKLSGKESSVIPKEIENVQDENDAPWKIGRRIVEIGHLAEQLRSCVSCKAPLELHNIIEERRHGFASLLYIKCHCDAVNKVTTGKRHHASQKEKALVFDINTKAVFGK